MSCVKGIGLEFIDMNLKQEKEPHIIKLNQDEEKFMEKEIVRLEKEQIITRLHEKPKKCWVNNFFLRPKSDGSKRFILNLKLLNFKLKNESFQMEGMTETLRMIKKNSFLISVDLLQAYFHVYVSEQFQNFMIFKYKNVYYKFCVLANGLSTGPKIFVRLSKAITAYLRKKMIDILIYIDDSILCAMTREILIKNRDETIKTFEKCGFTVNYKKSVLEPCQRLEFLGFVIDTIE